MSTATLPIQLLNFCFRTGLSGKTRSANYNLYMSVRDFHWETRAKIIAGIGIYFWDGITVCRASFFFRNQSKIKLILINCNSQLTNLANQSQPFDDMTVIWHVCLWQDGDIVRHLYFWKRTATLMETGRGFVMDHRNNVSPKLLNHSYGNKIDFISNSTKIKWPKSRSCELLQYCLYFFS